MDADYSNHVCRRRVTCDVDGQRISLVKPKKGIVTRKLLRWVAFRSSLVYEVSHDTVKRHLRVGPGGMKKKKENR